MATALGTLRALVGDGVGWPWAGVEASKAGGGSKTLARCQIPNLEGSAGQRGAGRGGRGKDSSLKVLVPLESGSSGSEVGVRCLYF